MINEDKYKENRPIYGQIKAEFVSGRWRMRASPGSCRWQAGPRQAAKMTQNLTARACENSSEGAGALVLAPNEYVLDSTS